MASWRIQSRVKEYFIWILLLQMSVLGVFTSLDLLLFFVFFEFELIPMYMLISIWGSGRKEYSATKFVIFTLAGGAFMLIAILALFSSSSVTNLSMVSIPELGIIGIHELTKYLNNQIKLKQAEELIVIKTRQYAKRQTTWARSRMIEWTKIEPQQLSSTIKKINKSSLKLDQLI